MVQRKIARKLNAEELQSWEGLVCYLSHLAMVNTKSETTPMRITLYSSQLYRWNYLNGCLEKCPDINLKHYLGFFCEKSVKWWFFHFYHFNISIMITLQLFFTDHPVLQQRDWDRFEWFYGRWSDKARWPKSSRQSYVSDQLTMLMVYIR